MGNDAPPVPAKVESANKPMTGTVAPQPPSASSLAAPGPAPAAPATTSVDMAPPQLGATFVPGGGDDYYMPEVLAPSPQRVMPEVPQNMQQDLQRLEQQSAQLQGKPQPAISANQNTAAHHTRDPSLSTVLKGEGAAAGGGPGGSDSGSASQSTVPVPLIQEPATEFRPFEDDKNATYDKIPTHNTARMDGPLDPPSFSPFPRVKGDNIPLSDEEKEDILYNAREHVLHSNNVSMQLSWARDSLAWVELMAEAWQRDNKGLDRPRTPKVEHELREDALSIVQYLAEQGHPEALFMRSKWLEFGKFGQRADKREAYLGYRKAAEQGWGRAEYRMGMLYENSNEMDKAIRHYTKGMEQGDSAASYRLGMMNLLGQHGYPKDYQRGLDLIKNAADTADEDAPQGAYVYGMLISKDLHDLTIPDNILPTNLNLARQYIEKAAFLGFAKAQSKMGQAYELGQLGCDFNPAFSLHYYGLAAQQGQPEASLGVSRWFLFGYEGIFAKNEPLAFKFAKSAADAGLDTAAFAMGYYYEIGIHIKKDLREARNWYEKAADKGNRDAEQRLESLRQSKSLTKEDHETTTLTRIKSQHGSQRGKRPDRFKPKEPAAMPTLAEGPPTPIDGPASGRGPSPGHSPVTNGFDASAGRPPAFGVNVDPNRSRSVAPYPEDDRPPPLNLALRPVSAAPYPDDDSAPYNHVPVSPHYNPQIRSSGPLAERPNSAFGIRGQSSSGPYDSQRPVQAGGMRQSQSAGSGLGPHPPADSQPPRGRVVSAPGWDQHQQPYNNTQQPYNNTYRQSSSSPSYGNNGYGQIPPQMSGGAGPGAPQVGDPTRNRLSKAPPAGPVYPGGPAYHANAAVAGRDYGPRSSSRPVSEQPQGYDPRYNSMASPPGNGAGRPMSTRPPDRYDSLPPQQQGYARPPQQLKDRPSPITEPRQSAPPGQYAGGGGRPSHSPGPTGLGGVPGRKPIGGGSGNSTPAPGSGPNSKPAAQGPATFEEMGIPQGKNDGDCIVM